MSFNYKRKTINPITRETEYTNCKCCNREITEVVHIDGHPYGVKCAYTHITGNKASNIDTARHFIRTVAKHESIQSYVKCRPVHFQEHASPQKLQLHEEQNTDIEEFMATFNVESLISWPEPDKE